MAVPGWRVTREIAAACCDGSDDDEVIDTVDGKLSTSNQRSGAR